VPNIAKPLAETIERAQRYAAEARAASTLAAYRNDLDCFDAWRSANDLAPSPATVALYVTHLAESGFALSTIRRRMAALNQVLEPRPGDAPEVRAVLRGIARSNTRKQAHTTPLERDALRRALDTLGSETIDVRDRAILVVGWYGALRRSEIVGLDAESLHWTADGVELHIAHAKTDATGYGQIVRLPQTEALAAWIEHAEVETGPIFRGVNRHGTIASKRLSARAVDLVVKRRCGEEYSAHSLRAGFATAASRAGIPDRIIMRHTRHKSAAVFARYAQDGRGWTDNAAARLG
jgi:integrase